MWHAMIKAFSCRAIRCGKLFAKVMLDQASGSKVGCDNG
jgi:hypothetical protein